MPSNLLFNSENVIFDNYDNNSKTLTIKDVEDETYYLTFDNYVPETLIINVINSKVSIIENYKGNLNQCHFIINVDETSSLNRFSIFVDNKTNQKISREINNHNYYQSMQIDLSTCNIDNSENINLLNQEAYSNVIAGIYAINKSVKKYQTNLNHYVANCVSKAQLFAINNDNAHVSIYTDAYIKNKAVGSKTNQEGRIINLSDKCSGIVLPNLHIDENDVEASHSCSVGSVNQDHLYYLETRGLTPLQARNILIRGYFNPILENIENEKIKEEIIEILQQRIG